ncbi:MAG: hypothetical protein AAF802_32745, partial [Planctomycetota bacterium]
TLLSPILQRWFQSDRKGQMSFGLQLFFIEDRLTCSPLAWPMTVTNGYTTSGEVAVVRVVGCSSPPRDP